MTINLVKWPFRKALGIWRLHRTHPSNNGVVQIFLNDGLRETSYSLSNFPSLLMPGSVGDIWYDIALFDPLGTIVFQESIKIPRFGSRQIIPAKIWPGKLPKFGIFQAGISGKRLSFLEKMRLRPLGRLTSHFYTFFHSVEYTSLAMIHPQTTAPVPESSEPSNFWYSQHLIQTKSLKNLEIFQINPCSSSYELNVKLVNVTGNVVCESAAVVPGFGIRQIIWDKADYGSEEYLYVASDTLRGNEKPILFSHYQDGSFTALHS